MDNDPHPTNDGAPQRPKVEGGEMNAEANSEALARLSRRRALLRGLGAGSAALAAVTPIKSLAFTASVTGTPNGKLCSISGTQSGAHSSTTITAVCGGRNPDYYKLLQNWPNYDSVAENCSFSNGTKSFKKGAKFSAVFGSGSSEKGVFRIVKDTPRSDEAHWIVALLNANITKAGYVAPYSPAEVVTLYSSPDQPAALAFFKGYMETLTD